MARTRLGPYCGILNLNKPRGLTSRAVVDRVSGPLRGAKAGHAGTLDPLATGVLVVCVGAATRLIESIQRMPKTYRTTIRLGARSDTLDTDGQVVNDPSAVAPSRSAIQEAIAGQVGTIAQVPPQFSALKQGGRRAYDLARSGQSVDLPARPVRIDRIEVLDYAWPDLILEIDCGGGTYIRSIARDVGEALGCGGLVATLERTRIGSFTVADAVAPEAITAETLPGLLRPAIEAVGDLPGLRLSSAQVAAIRQGKAVEIDHDQPGPGAAPEVALIGPDGTLVAIADWDLGARRVAPRRVLDGC